MWYFPYLVKCRKDVVSKLYFCNCCGASNSHANAKCHNSLFTQRTVEHSCFPCINKKLNIEFIYWDNFRCSCNFSMLLDRKGRPGRRCFVVPSYSVCTLLGYIQGKVAFAHDKAGAVNSALRTLSLLSFHVFMNLLGTYEHSFCHCFPMHYTVSISALGLSRFSIFWAAYINHDAFSADITQVLGPNGDLNRWGNHFLIVYLIRLISRYSCFFLWFCVQGINNRNEKSLLNVISVTNLVVL